MAIPFLMQEPPPQAAAQSAVPPLGTPGPVKATPLGRDQLRGIANMFDAIDKQVPLLEAAAADIFSHAPMGTDAVRLLEAIEASTIQVHRKGCTLWNVPLRVAIAPVLVDHGRNKRPMTPADCATQGIPYTVSVHVDVLCRAQSFPTKGGDLLIKRGKCTLAGFRRTADAATRVHAACKTEPLPPGQECHDVYAVGHIHFRIPVQLGSDLCPASYMFRNAMHLAGATWKDINNGVAIDLRAFLADIGEFREPDVIQAPRTAIDNARTIATAAGGRRTFYTTKMGLAPDREPEPTPPGPKPQRGTPNMHTHQGTVYDPGTVLVQGPLADVPHGTHYTAGGPVYIGSTSRTKANVAAVHDKSCTSFSRTDGLPAMGSALKIKATATGDIFMSIHGNTVKVPVVDLLLLMGMRGGLVKLIVGDAKKGDTHTAGVEAALRQAVRCARGDNPATRRFMNGPVRIGNTTSDDPDTQAWVQSATTNLCKQSREGLCKQDARSNDALEVRRVLDGLVPQCQAPPTLADADFEACLYQRQIYHIADMVRMLLDATTNVSRGGVSTHPVADPQWYTTANRAVFTDSACVAEIITRAMLFQSIGSKSSNNTLTARGWTEDFQTRIRNMQRGVSNDILKYMATGKLPVYKAAGSVITHLPGQPCVFKSLAMGTRHSLMLSDAGARNKATRQPRSGYCLRTTPENQHIGQKRSTVMGACTTRGTVKNVSELVHILVGSTPGGMDTKQAARAGASPTDPYYTFVYVNQRMMGCVPSSSTPELAARIARLKKQRWKLQTVTDTEKAIATLTKTKKTPGGRNAVPVAPVPGSQTFDNLPSKRMRAIIHPQGQLALMGMEVYNTKGALHVLNTPGRVLRPLVPMRTARVLPSVAFRGLPRGGAHAAARMQDGGTYVQVPALDIFTLAGATEKRLRQNVTHHIKAYASTLRTPTEGLTVYAIQVQAGDSTPAKAKPMRTTHHHLQATACLMGMDVRIDTEHNIATFVPNRRQAGSQLQGSHHVLRLCIPFLKELEAMPKEALKNTILIQFPEEPGSPTVQVPRLCRDAWRYLLTIVNLEKLGNPLPTHTQWQDMSTMRVRRAPMPPGLYAFQRTEGKRGLTVLESLVARGLIEYMGEDAERRHCVVVSDTKDIACDANPIVTQRKTTHIALPAIALFSRVANMFPFGGSTLPARLIFQASMAMGAIGTAWTAACRARQVPTNELKCLLESKGMHIMFNACSPHATPADRTTGASPYVGCVLASRDAVEKTIEDGTYISEHVADLWSTIAFRHRRVASTEDVPGRPTRHQVGFNATEAAKAGVHPDLVQRMVHMLREVHKRVCEEARDPDYMPPFKPDGSVGCFFARPGARMHKGAPIGMRIEEINIGNGHEDFTVRPVYHTPDVYGTIHEVLVKTRTPSGHTATTYLQPGEQKKHNSATYYVVVKQRIPAGPGSKIIVYLIEKCEIANTVPAYRIPCTNDGAAAAIVLPPGGITGRGLTVLDKESTYAAYSLHHRTQARHQAARGAMRAVCTFGNNIALAEGAHAANAHGIAKPPIAAPPRLHRATHQDMGGIVSVVLSSKIATLDFSGGGWKEPNIMSRDAGHGKGGGRRVGNMERSALHVLGLASSVREAADAGGATYVMPMCIACGTPADLRAKEPRVHIASHRDEPVPGEMSIIKQHTDGIGGVPDRERAMADAIRRGDYTLKCHTCGQEDTPHFTLMHMNATQLNVFTHMARALGIATTYTMRAAH